MKRRLYHIALFTSFVFCLKAKAQHARTASKRAPQTTVDVLVVGAGASGVTAAIQAARLGAKVALAEPTAWLGGMITAAGVSAFDGNHNMPSGIWAEFRAALYKVYGGPKAVETGWVSNTLFEPHIGDSIFKAMVAQEPNIKVYYNNTFKNIETKAKLQVVYFGRLDQHDYTIRAKQVIDATEFGDVMAQFKIPFDVGMEASSKTGENINVPADNDIVQDITYVAILKDYGPVVDCTIVKPQGYNPMEFDGCCNEYCSKPEKLASNVTAQKMLDYGKLPNGKYMINWPGKGNDIYLNLTNFTPAQRTAALKKAKAKTLRFIYFLQTQFGYKNLALADDEFPTSDRLPFIPYIRESRRMKGLVRFNVQHVAKPFESNLYRTGIAVGDYPIDHHHRENEKAPQHLGFYPVPSFNLPMGVLLPATNKPIIVAEKSTSISNAVNGTTRLQPIVMLTGQAAGALAALAVSKNVPAKQVPVRVLQNQLLQSGAYIMPYFDVKPDHAQFAAIQKIGATGLLKGVGEPYKWANRTWFYPDSLVKVKELYLAIEKFYAIALQTNADEWLSYEGASALMYEIGKKTKMVFNMPFERIDPKANITKAQLAKMMCESIRPFDLDIDINGDIVTKK